MPKEAENLWEVISTYSRKEAIEDGHLVDLSANFPDLCRDAGIKANVAASAAAWEVIRVNRNAEDNGESNVGRVWDLLIMTRHAMIRSQGYDRLNFACAFTNAEGRLVTRRFRLLLTPEGEGGRGVLTIMLEREVD